MTEYDIAEMLNPKPKYQPTQQQEQTTKTDIEPPKTPENPKLITKAVAAQEVMNQLKIIKMLGIISMAGMFLSLIAYTLSQIAGAVVAIGIVVYIAIQTRNSNELAKKLKSKYGVN